MDPCRILVVAREAAERESLVAALQGAGYAPTVARDLQEALRDRLRSADVLVLDRSSFAGSPGASATEALDELVRFSAQTPFLVTLRQATVEDAVGLMRRGAFSVVSLPVDPENLAFQVDQALRHRELCSKNAELERSLEVHQRLAMIGKLAAGVAHELNNPLDGVLRYVNLCIEALPKDGPQIPYLLEARRGLRRMADIVRDLLQFSRNASVEVADEDAERLARDAVLQVVCGAQRPVEARFEFPPVGIPLPRGMFQVLGNLAKNAVDAMPQGGVLTVSARLHDGRVRIQVADTGTGIPEEIRDRVFEPFFTTKEVGKGTGLGLSICQRIVERLGGTLSIESELGRGTVVTIELPARRAGPGSARRDTGAGDGVAVATAGRRGRE